MTALDPEVRDLLAAVRATLDAVASPTPTPVIAVRGTLAAVLKGAAPAIGAEVLAEEFEEAGDAGRVGRADRVALAEAAAS